MRQIALPIAICLFASYGCAASEESEPAGGGSSTSNGGSLGISGSLGVSGSTVLPTAGTSVAVEDSVLDRYGLPVAAITIDRHPADLPVTRYLIERGEDLLRAMEPDAVWRVTEAGETTILQHGTCRFGDDPATSVLDRDCRTHTVPNLWVVDGSFMPTSGGNPNTLTIMANAYRVADRLVQKVKSGKL